MSLITVKWLLDPMTAWPYLTEATLVSSILTRLLTLTCHEHKNQNGAKSSLCAISRTGITKIHQNFSCNAWEASQVHPFMPHVHPCTTPFIYHLNPFLKPRRTSHLKSQISIIHSFENEAIAVFFSMPTRPPIAHRIKASPDFARFSSHYTPSWTCGNAGWRFQRRHVCISPAWRLCLP